MTEINQNHQHKHLWLSLDTIGIEITSHCNLKCHGCDRSCRQAPSTEMMTVQQINKFITETKELNKTWRSIAILGGEPTLHPNIIEILTNLSDAKISTDIGMITNGFSQQVQNIIKTVPKSIRIQNTKKTTPDQDTFAPFNIAPIDVNYNLKKTKCKLPWKCGIGLGRYGFYCCQPGSSIDRVFGYNIGIKHLKDVTPEALWAMHPKLCALCGYTIDDPLNHHSRDGKSKTISPTWQKAYEDYKTNPPVLELY